MAIKKLTEEQEKAKGNDFEKRFNRFTEEVKVRNDYLRHIATLDTGSIVVIVTLLQKNVRPETLIYISISIFSFVLSLLAVIASQSNLVNGLSDAVDNENKLPNKGDRRLYTVGEFISYSTFMFGIGSLCAFFILNVLNI